MKPLIILLIVAAGSFCLPGTFDVSWSRVQFLSDPHPWLADNFDFFSIGNSFEVSRVFEAVIRTGYGTTEPSELPTPPEGNYIDDEAGRLWTVEAGARANLPDREMFFLRGTAGAACILLDYYEGTSSHSFSRKTESSWEPSFSIGLGSRFDLSFLHVFTHGEFTLSIGRLGSYGTAGGELSLGI